MLSVHRMPASSRAHSWMSRLTVVKLVERVVGSIWLSSPTTPTITSPTSNAMESLTMGSPAKSLASLRASTSCRTATAVLTARASSPSSTTS